MVAMRWTDSKTARREDDRFAAHCLRRSFAARLKDVDV